MTPEKYKAPFMDFNELPQQLAECISFTRYRKSLTIHLAVYFFYADRLEPRKLSLITSSMTYIT